MKRLYDFQCTTCQSQFDKYTEYCATTSCPSCGNDAQKIISAPTIKLEGITGAFPGAAARWEKMHNQRSKQRD
jgi:putative FmdB family regulatory protein